MVRFAIPEVDTHAIAESADTAANSYIQIVNAQGAAAYDKLRQARLKAFAQAFV